MTDSLNAAGALLTASAEDRTITYRLLPFGEEGRTSLGRVIASKGSVTIPENPAEVTLNLEHEYKRPVGRAVNITEDEDGLTATFRVARTSAGDDLLAEAQDGLRTGVSVEIASPVIRGGRLISGLLEAAGAVVRPAFPSALLMAEDHGDLDTSDTAIAEPEDTNSEDTESDELTDTPNTEQENDMTAVPAALNAADNAAATPVANLETISKALATRDQHLAASISTEEGPGLFAALAPIPATGNEENVEQVQWIGQMWDHKTYVRKYASLIGHGVLTSWKVQGWRFKTTPTVADYAGDLAEIHSSTATTEPYTTEAARIAGGWKVDRKFADFGDTSFLQGLFEAAVEDYARKSDAKVLLAMQDAARDVTAGPVPTGVNPSMARLVDGALALIDESGAPSFALVATDVYREMLLSRDDDGLAYLSSSLGFEDGSFGNFRLVPSADLEDGTIIVGSSAALTLYELPGTPIRVSALDVSRGGIDEALFGYYAIVDNGFGLVNVVADEA